MDNEHAILYFKMQLLQAEIEMQGMIAENKLAESMQQFPVFHHQDFVDLIEKHGVHHNQFPFYKGE